MPDLIDQLIDRYIVANHLNLPLSVEIQYQSKSKKS